MTLPSLFPVRVVLLTAICLAANPVAAQFEPPTVERGPVLPDVTAFPPPGTYSNTTGITLIAPDGARVHYTLDGSKPTEESARFEPSEPIVLHGLYDGMQGMSTGYTIRAVAVRPGFTDSDPQTFGYTIERRDRDEYVSQEIVPGVRMIRDSENVKFYLIRGRDAYALIDSGMGRGDVAQYVRQFTGDLPLKMVITHRHGDHIAQASQFIETTPVHVGAGDRDAVAEFLGRQGVDAEVLARNLLPVETGATIDLGDRALEIVMVPGHTPGSLAVLDPASGTLFTGDTFGNNSPLPPDVMWLQWAEEPVDAYLARVRAARRLLDGRVERILTGHNDRALVGTTYLDNLERAFQRGLDQGREALLPSVRPTGGVQLVEGDMRTDPDWFGVNVNPVTFLPAPPLENARLGDLVVEGARLSPAFDPGVTDYTLAQAPAGHFRIRLRPSSTRAQSLSVNGVAVASQEPVALDPSVTNLVTVISGDGEHTMEYRIAPAR